MLLGVARRANMTMVGMRSRSRSIKQRLCAVNTKPMKIKTAWLHQQRHESTSERTNAWTKSSRAKLPSFGKTFGIIFYVSSRKLSPPTSPRVKQFALNHPNITPTNHQFSPLDQSRTFVFRGTLTWCFLKTMHLPKPRSSDPRLSTMASSMS